MPQTRVFITHSWRDIDFAQRLYNDLKAHGLEVWFDDKSLQPGHRMAEEINRGLAWCDVYIPIISRESLASKWCDEEINAAISLSVEGGNAKPRIISALVGDCRDELKKRYPSLVARLYVNFTGRYDDALRELLTKGLGLSVESMASVPRQVSLNRLWPFRHKPSLQIAISIAITIGGIVACFVFSFGLWRYLNEPMPTLIAQASRTPLSLTSTPIVTATPVPPTAERTLTRSAVAATATALPIKFGAPSLTRPIWTDDQKDEVKFPSNAIILDWKSVGGLGGDECYLVQIQTEAVNPVTGIGVASDYWVTLCGDQTATGTSVKFTLESPNRVGSAPNYGSILLNTDQMWANWSITVVKNLGQCAPSYQYHCKWAPITPPGKGRFLFRKD